LILSGTDDPIIPTANARLMRWLIPNATLHLFDDGHLGLVTQAELLAPRVSEFVSLDEDSHVGGGRPSAS
jgi:pimeloyl-ACP methyl ester carboxylesterase